MPRTTRLHSVGAVLLISMVVGPVCGQDYTISTFAGGGLPANMAGTSANIHPGSVAVDKAGNLFFADASSAVFRLDAKTGILTVVAGNGTPGFSGDNGAATYAQLHGPNGVAVDSAGNLYIADLYNNRVRKVSNGVITTVAGDGTAGYAGDNGPAANARLSAPADVALDTAGNLYICDMLNARIRKISGGVIGTAAGSGVIGYRGDNGPATSAAFNYPRGIALDASGNLYIADTNNNRVRKVSGGAITTVAGTGTAGFGGDNGPPTAALLNSPNGVAVDATGNVYIADLNNARVRKISGTVIFTVAGGGNTIGDNIIATGAQMSGPTGAAVDIAGNLYIADPADGRVRKVVRGVITTVAGGSLPLGTQFGSAGAVATDGAGNVYIADTSNNLVRKISNGVVTTIAGNGAIGWNAPQGIAVDSKGDIYVADSGNNVIRKISGGVVATFAGSGIAGYSGDNGPATSARLSSPVGVAVDGAGNVYVSDAGNHRVRKVSGGVITTVAGTGTSGFNGDNGPATSAQLFGPAGLALDAGGNLYIADSGNNRVRRVSGGVIATVAGSGVAGFGGDGATATRAALADPQGVAVDASGNLYIADTNNLVIRKVSNGSIATVAGNGTCCFGGDGGPATSAQLDYPVGVAVDGGGKVYIADGSNRIRVLTPAALPSINPGGIVPNDGTVSVIQSGSWVSIFGSNLAGGTALWNGDFPQSLIGTSVMVDNRPAYLWYVSPQQINLQVPDDAATGVVEVVVTTASGSASATVTLATYAPSFSLLGDGKHVAGEIAMPNKTGVYGDYDLVGPANTFSFVTRPVKASEVLVLYGVGFGPTTPTVPAGQPFLGAAPTNIPVTVTIGGVSAQVAFAGIVGAGLYQLNVTVPANTGSGDQALQATVNGIQTPLGPVVTVQ